MSKKADEIGAAVYARELEPVNWPGEDGDALALADTMVNTGLDPVKNPEMFAPKYKARYIKRGASFWADVRQAWRAAKYGA